MNSGAGQPICQPVSIWKRPIEVKLGVLAKALGKGIIAGAFGNWTELAQSAVDTLDGLGLKTQDTGAIAWLLVQRALLQAMSDLTKEHQKSLKQEPDFKILCEQVDWALEKSELSLDSNFFNTPKDIPILEVVKESYYHWLQTYGLSVIDAKVIAERLPRYFVFALHQQWRLHPQNYAPLKEQLETPFTKASERELAWMRYSARLQKRVDEPMFGEAFGLRQVYIPLRAYYEQKVKAEQINELSYSICPKDEVERVVVALETEICNWLDKGDKEDTIRVICGEPGCGKSSFARMLAARLAEEQKLPVLFIPLHQFDLKGDLVDAMSDFTQKKNLDDMPPNPLERENAQKRLLLIFDGLDELAMQGEIAVQVAQDFIQEVQGKLSVFNSSEVRVLALICGRELIVEASRSKIRRDWQILHILPYFQTDEEPEKYRYVDVENLLEQDQRQIWWKTYANLKGLKYDGLPQELNQGNLIEITAQPLLNYLVALSYDRGKLEFSKESNLNAVYADLLEQVYQRDWENRPYPIPRSIDERNFIRILEEIAVACWHGNKRTATVSEIEKRCTSINLKQILEVFQKGVQEGVNATLTAFYFRQSGIHGSEPTFEFTHKSFGEYLTTRRIVRELGLIQQQLSQHRKDPDIGWDEKECLKRWVIICGSSPLDEYLLKFLRDEIRLQNKEHVRQWQQTLCDLIGFMLWHGMPMEKLDPRPRYLEETRQSRNAEEALLAVLSCCAYYTETISQIKWPDLTIFRTWLTRLQGQKIGPGSPVAFHCLNDLDLHNCILEFSDLRDADLNGSNLEGASLDGASLHGASLIDASLVGARLYRVRLDGARLCRANLNGASLVGASLDGANLNEASLVGASLDGASLDRASLDGARFDNISWNRETTVKNATGLETAHRVPDEWRVQSDLTIHSIF
jgi:energy-coupling factor transporter ATP-binding protein EcfA2